MVIHLGVGMMLIIAIALRLYLYGMGGTHIPVTTDEAFTVLQALDIRNGEFPLLLTAQPYMFPLEAYWMAPFVNILPRTALGMRALVLAEGCVFVLLSLLVLRRMGPWRVIWPGVLLILFPSVYLVMNMTAYSLPHNHSAYILALIAAWFVLRLNEPPGRRDFLLAAGGGFFAALAFSNAMISLALIVPLAIVALWHVVGRGFWPRFIGYGFGAGIGLLPHFIARWTMPGAHQSVTATRTMADALERAWSPTLTDTLPVTFGWKPCLFPDTSENLNWGSWGNSLFPYVFAGLLVLAIGLCIHRVWLMYRQGERIRLGGLEFALGSTLLCCILFMLSKRADSSSFRYLLPVVVVFPFLITGILTRLPSGWLRSAITGLVVLVASYNIAVSIRLPLEWRHPDFATDVLATPDLEPALQYLRKNGIRHAVASHWATYRINFEADGDVISSQPLNERFPGWPIPNKTLVDAATNMAFVLTEKIRFLKPSVFNRHLNMMGVHATIVTAGHFVIYHDFESPMYRNAERVGRDRMNITSSESPHLTDHLMDEDHETFWRSEQRQHTNLWTEFSFIEPLNISHMVLHFGTFAHDQAPAVSIQLLTESGWHFQSSNTVAALDKFAWLNGHPAYGYSQQTYPINAENIRAMRVQVAEADPDWCWTIADASIFAKPANSAD